MADVIAATVDEPEMDVVTRTDPAVAYDLASIVDARRYQLSFSGRLQQG